MSSKKIEANTRDLNQYKVHGSCEMVQMNIPAAIYLVNFDSSYSLEDYVNLFFLAGEGGGGEGG